MEENYDAVEEVMVGRRREREGGKRGRVSGGRGRH